MEQDERKRRDEELDRFWDIDALIPPKRAAHYTADTETAEIVLEQPTKGTDENGGTEAPRSIPIPKNEDAPKPHFIPPHTADEVKRQPRPDVEYTPENALIRKVRLYRWKSSFRYYEGFVRDAERLKDVHGVECPRAPFFSYVPQYSQMSRQQLEWYLWWRENVRNGHYPDTDYSYLLLYAYELINLADKQDVAAAQTALCELWIRYRGIFRQLDSYLPDWICDFSLIHRLPPPNACTGRLLPEVMAHCNLKEFYVPSGGEDGYVRALLAFCSNYDYHKSKFCNGESEKLFDLAVRGALREVTRHLSNDGQLFSKSGMDDSKLTRDAYTGALCSYRNKRRIEVEFCSFSRSHELRYFVTDVVKYTENRIRAVIGVRSRLSVYALSTPVRQLLDAYLDQALPARAETAKKKKENAESAAYEKLYDLPRKELSLADAAQIERLSWDTTEKLVEAFEEAEPQVDVRPIEPLPAAFAPVAPTDSGEDTADVLRNAMHPYLAFLRAVYDGDAVGQRNAAKEKGLPLEVLADEVNALAAEHMGDILLEESDDGYAVIEDYRESLAELF